MSDNLELWKLVEKTDPKQVKAITGKPYKGNSPKPHYLVQKATETFGPCGIGWGFKILAERVENAAEGDKVHIAHIQVWYVWGDKRGEVEHVGQTMFSGKRNDGKLYTDEDAPKKSVTDALVKALSMIGFAGDIFMGRYDDSKYVQEIGQEFAEQQRIETPRKSSASLKRDDAWNKLMFKLSADFGDCKTRVTLSKLRADYREQARANGWPRAWLEALAEEFDSFEDKLPQPDDGDVFPPDRANAYVDNFVP